MRPLPETAPKTARRLLILCALALACAACGKSAAAGTQNPSTHTTSAPATTTTSTTTQSTTTTSTTSALPGAGKPHITVGDKNYTEQFVLGQLYLQALTAQGFSVSVNQNIGPTSVTLAALKSGALSMYPEYLNVFNTDVAGYRHGFHSVLTAYQGAQHWALAHGLVLLAPTPFSDTDAIAVTDAYAQLSHLRTIGDLRHVAAQLTVGGPPQFQTGAPGLPQLRAAYGVVPAGFKAMAVGDQYAALDDDAVQAADVNTTDGELATGDYQLLSDPKRVFGYGNVVPVVAGKVLTEEGPAFMDTIQRVDDDLTTNAMRQMNEAVDVAGQNPADVAKQFLQTHGLLIPLDM